jgi:hypothetical protein
MSRLNRVFVVLAIFGTFLSLRGEPSGVEQTKTITLIVTFDEAKAPPEVVEALQSELAEIWRTEHVKLDWRPIESIQPGDSFADLVVVHFKGDCHLRPESFASRPYLIDERGPQGPGPFAYSPTVDGQVQPFSSVLCNRVERSVQSALQANQRDSANSLFGRALGRVLSHELYHILNQTKKHERLGLAKKSLTGEQLIAPEFRFHEPGSHAGQ